MSRIAVQVYTVRSVAEQDLMGVLEAISDLGYQGVEFAGFYGNDVDEVRRKLDELSLVALGAHVRLEEFQGDIEKVVDQMTTIGAEFALIPWIDQDLRTPEQMTAFVKDFERYSSRLRDAGIRFGYHNHDFEFRTTMDDGRTLWEFLVESTNPEVMFFELDPFWSNVGGADPVDVLKTYGNRIGILQLKDGDASDPTIDRPFGEGALDWEAMFAECERLGITDFIMEQDYPTPSDPLGDLGRSIENSRRYPIFSQL